MRSTISFKRFCLNGFNMDNLFNVTLLPASYSVAGTDDSWYLIGSVPPSSADIESLMFGADVVSKHLLNADIPWVIVLSNNNNGARVFQNVYLCSINTSILNIMTSHFFVVNKAFCNSCLSVDICEADLNILHENYLTWISCPSWIKQQYNERGMLCYTIFSG